MQKLFFAALIGTAVLSAAGLLGGLVMGKAVFFIFALSFGVLFYHISMRLAVAHLVKHGYNFRNAWFSEKTFEKPLYKKLRVRRWKKHLPSGNPASYALESRTPFDIVQTMCRNEVIHEISAVLSLVPILLGAWYGAWGVWIATSVFGSLCDLPFICMQRYNRPRLVRLMEKQNRESRL